MPNAYLVPLRGEGISWDPARAYDSLNARLPPLTQPLWLVLLVVLMGAGVKVAEDAAAYARQPNPEDQRPEVEIVVVDTILKALYLALPPPPQTFGPRESLGSLGPTQGQACAFSPSVRP